MCVVRKIAIFFLVSFFVGMRCRNREKMEKGQKNDRFSVDGLEDLYNFTAHHLLSSTFYNAFALELKLN